MKFCDNNHNEICYDADKCPLCELREELEARLRAKKNIIYYLEEDLRNANEELERLREEKTWWMLRKGKEYNPEEKL